MVLIQPEAPAPRLILDLDQLEESRQYQNVSRYSIDPHHLKGMQLDETAIEMSFALRSEKTRQSPRK